MPLGHNEVYYGYGNYGPGNVNVSVKTVVQRHQRLRQQQGDQRRRRGQEGELPARQDRARADRPGAEPVRGAARGRLEDPRQAAGEGDHSRYARPGTRGRKSRSSAFRCRRCDSRTSPSPSGRGSLPRPGRSRSSSPAASRRLSRIREGEGTGAVGCPQEASRLRGPSLPRPPPREGRHRPPSRSARCGSRPASASSSGSRKPRGKRPWPPSGRSCPRTGRRARR